MRPGSDCENVHCDLHHGHEGPHLNAHGPVAGSDRSTPARDINENEALIENLKLAEAHHAAEGDEDAASVMYHAHRRIDALRTERDEYAKAMQMNHDRAVRLHSEVERMRPVVEAACEVRDLRRSAGMPVTTTDAAVDTYREAEHG